MDWLYKSYMRWLHPLQVGLLSSDVSVIYAAHLSHRCHPLTFQHCYFHVFRQSEKISSISGAQTPAVPSLRSTEQSSEAWNILAILFLRHALYILNILQKYIWTICVMLLVNTDPENIFFRIEEISATFLKCSRFVLWYPTYHDTFYGKNPFICFPQCCW